MIFPVFSLCIFVVATRVAWRGTLENILYAIAWFFFLSISLIQLARLFVVIPWAIPLTIYAQSAFASLFIGLSMIWQVQARQRELHRSLEKSNARYRLAVEGSAAAIYEYHWTSRRLEGGERLARIVDLPGIGADGSPLARIGMTSRHAIIRALVEALRKRSRHFSAEALLPKPDGGQMLSITGAILYGPDGRPSSLCGSVIDVTSEHALALERSLRSQLEIAKQRTERALAARMRIFTAINHDLRHPFLALGLYLDILNRHRDAARVEQHIDQIRAAYQSANSYLNIATEVIRNESIDEPLTFIDVDVAQMLREQQVLFSGAASSIGMVIDVQARRLFIRTDRVVLERIVGNLVANAMRHSRGTRAVLACRMIAGHPTIIISDNGRGIDTAKQTTLFHDFARREREDGEGLGVGLGIARRLAHSLGARLSLRSKPGQGTRLAISFDAPD